MAIWIGTSGYSYPDWVGGFYPCGTRSNQMLGWYSRYFPLVELNFSYYQVPTAGHLGRLARQTPDGFQFLVKLHRSLSHHHDRRELPRFREAVAELRRQGKLLGLLCQLPQAIHHDEKSRRWLEMLAGELAGFPLAVEFRHRSWFRPDVPVWLRDHGMDLVAVDVPDIPALYPRGLVRSDRTVYVRWHSRAADKWYTDDASRYDYHYSDDELADWIRALAAEPAERSLLLFNNCQRTQAAHNARRMQELLAKLAPHLEVVEPFAAKERSLFD